jgi:4-alpha-glucanotransferase
MLVEWVIDLRKPTPEKCECPNSIPQTTRESAMDRPNPKPEPEHVNPAHEKATKEYEEARVKTATTSERLRAVEEDLLESESLLERGEALCEKRLERLKAESDADNVEVADLLQTRLKLFEMRVKLTAARAQFNKERAQFEARNTEQGAASQKIQSLLRIAERPRGNDGTSNGAEALAALEKAQELASKYRLNIDFVVRQPSQ